MSLAIVASLLCGGGGKLRIAGVSVYIYVGIYVGIYVLYVNNPGMHGRFYVLDL